MELTKIGVIVNTHGLSGTLKVKSFTDFKNERYKKNITLYIAYKDELIPVTVNNFRSVKGIECINFNEFTNINECEKYKGSELFISQDLIHELDDDEYYFEELIGMDVYTDVYIGKVEDVREVPQGELLEVKRENKKDALIPFNKHFVKEVNKKERTITLLLWEGLL
jgi:16S rRNA processing protein RimM